MHNTNHNTHHNGPEVKDWKAKTLKALSGFVVLGGALYGISLTPAYSQPTPPAPSATDAPRTGELRPLQGDVKVDPTGRLVAPRGEERLGDGPRDGGPRERGPKDGPDERGPREGGPRDKGPKDGPRERGPKGGPRDDERGPRGPRGRKDGPDKAPRGPEAAMEHAYRGAAELERYGQLQGDVFNLTGQARDYYNRAGIALKRGDTDESQQLAQTSERLIQAALHLAHAENGPLTTPRVVGWDAPPAAVRPPAPVEEGGMENRPLEDLKRDLEQTRTTPSNASWIETARSLATQAQKDMDAKRSDAGRERTMAARALLEAAEALQPR